MPKMKSITASIVRTLKGSLDLKVLPYSIGVTSSKGRGLYASKFIEKGTRIIRAPVIHFNKTDTDKVSETVLEHYIFASFNDEDTSWIPLGHALLMNHSIEANVDWFQSKDINVVDYIALTDIDVGEELLINYGYNPTNFKSSPMAKTF